MPRKPRASAAKPSASFVSSSPAPSPSDAIFFPTAEAFSNWLSKHHTSTPNGTWLRISKKSTTPSSVTYDEALDIALCHGWIDGQRKSLPQGTHFAQRFTPRRKNSLWSRRNVNKVEALTAAERMQPAGMAEVDAAKADGRWEKAYDGPRDMQVPGDFEGAVRARGDGAWEFFEGLGKSQRYAFLWRIQTAKKHETRARRIELFAGMLAEGKSL